MKSLRQGKAKLIIIASNTPVRNNVFMCDRALVACWWFHCSRLIRCFFQALQKSEIEYYAMLAKANVHHYSGSNVDLGTACGRFFRVSVLNIADAGDSDILTTITE
jgi:large subunit ribosomal protein L30e